MARQKSNADFVFRVKIGEYELEINGDKEEVLDTIRELPGLMANVYKAFESSRPKTKATITVSKTAPKEDSKRDRYPKIAATQSCSEAILNALGTNWGKWRPHTVKEMKAALKANGLDFPGRTLAGVLSGLVRKGKVRRWRTDDGYVYILAEKEVLA
ncbi:hypothetical protein GTO27_08360 [Candidatus Bathyarchaeota archaeon]|nr:hypothetical protein [Candidatus Bathyarchaeota archaeon]